MVALFIGGLGVLRYHVACVWSFDRMLAVAVTALLCALGGSVSGVVLVGGVGLVLAVAQVTRLRKYRRDTAPA